MTAPTVCVVLLLVAAVSHAESVTRQLNTVRPRERAATKKHRLNEMNVNISLALAISSLTVQP